MDNAFKHKNKMAAGIVVVILALVAGYMFFKADTDQMAGKTAVFHDKAPRQDNEIQGNTVENVHKTNTSQTRPKKVSMTDILEKAFVKKNKLFETRITESGVGKVLKFSKTLVIIYYLIDEQVVYDTVNQIQFDGSTIWIPHPKP